MFGISSPVKPSTYNFLRVSEGRTFFARVGIEPSVAPHGLEISIARTAFEDAKGWERYPGWAAAAERGVRYAFAHTTQAHTDGVHFLVTSIVGTEVDTCPDAVATAACFATWEALEISGAHEPRLESGKFIFDP